MINDHKTQSELKFQLIMQINFISSKDSDEIRNMHTKSDNTEIIISSEVNDIIEELGESILQSYQKILEELIKFVRDRTDFLY